MRKRDLDLLRTTLEDRLVMLYRSSHAKVRDGMSLRVAPSDVGEPLDEGDEAQRTVAIDDGITLGERDAALAQRIEAALRRMTAGAYGECVDCGSPIELPRLRLVPWAERCIADQEAWEATAGARPPSL